MSLSLLPNLQPSPITIRGNFGRLTNTRAAQPAANPAPKRAPKGKRARSERASIPHLLMGSNYTRTMQNFAFTSCSSAMFVRIVCGVGDRQVSYV